MLRQLVVFSFCNNWADMFANEYDVVRRHLDEGGDVVVYGCHGGLPLCRAKHNATHSHVCSICSFRREQTYSKLKHLPNFTYEVLPDVTSERLLPTTYTELLNYKYNGFSFGLCALSSTQVFHPDYDQSIALPQVTVQFLDTAIISYHKVIEVLRERNVSATALVYNGRLAEEFGALCAARSLGLEFAVHEVTGVDEKYIVVENASLHNIEFWHSLSQEFLGLVRAKPDVYAVGCSFFENKRNGVRTNDIVYIGADFKTFSIPKKFRNRKVIGLFNSSDHESRYTECGFQYTSVIAPTQFEAFRLIVDHFRNDSEVCFVLRIHPNALRGPRSDRDLLMSLESDNVLVIGPDQDISTYSVIDSCDLVISSYSTVGVEATFWGKPSISLVPTTYTGIPSTYCPESLDDLLNMINTNVAVRDRDAAVAYGAMCLLSGTSRKHVSGTVPNYIFGGVSLSRYSPAVYEAAVYHLLITWGLSPGIAHLLSLPLRYLSRIKHWIVNHQ